MILNELNGQYDNNVCDLFSMKEAFQKLYSQELKALKLPIMKREKVTINDLYAVAKNITVCDNETALKLSTYLYMKMMKDKEKIRPWYCSNCKFLNCELMVGGLWRYYNQANKCGLCGDFRDHKTTQIIIQNISVKKHQKRRSVWMEMISIPIEKDNSVPEPDIDLSDWNNDYLECTLNKSVKHLSNNQLIYLLDHYIFAQINKKLTKVKLSKSKPKIMEYFRTKKMNGKKFLSKNKKQFIKELKAYCGKKTLFALLVQLYNAIKEFNISQIHDLPKNDDSQSGSDEDLSNDCPALHRIFIVLKNFETITSQISRTNGLYPYNFEDYFKEFPGYSAVEFLNDINHVMSHDLQFTDECRNGESCIHFNRAFRGRSKAQYKTLDLKKQFFNTNDETDFVYISVLDRIHSLFMHSIDIDYNNKRNTVKKLLEDDAVKILYIPYNMGTYMEYHTLKPLYHNLFDELVHDRNKSYAITIEQFNLELETSKKVLQNNNTVKSWKACKTDIKYGIKVNEPIHIEHILCIKFYCNYKAFCGRFRASYRKNNPEDTNDDIINRHCNDHYWFGRFLTTAIEFYGEIAKRSDDFFHGLSGKFVFYNFSAVYEIPTSTTWDITFAQSFCNSNGIVLKLSPKYTDEVNNSRCLDVTILSDDKADKVKLFAGLTSLSITNIYNPSDNGWDGYHDYISAFLYFERIIEQTISQKQQYNHGKLKELQQEKYLVPLIKYQMDRNCYDDEKQEFEEKENEKEKLPRYICVLFGFFCDNKKNYIDLSCINQEISSMDDSLKNILFENVSLTSINNDELVKYKINNKNIQLIFPNLIEYKNHMGHWIYVNTTHEKNTPIVMKTPKLTHSKSDTMSSVIIHDKL